MKEEARINYIRSLRKEEKKLRKLKGKMKRIAVLKENPLVREYLLLESEIGKSFVTNAKKDILTGMLLDTSYEKYKKLCNHDGYVYYGYYEKTVKYPDGYFLYRCLECQEYIFVKPIVNEEFKNNNCIVNSIPANTPVSDYYNYRDEYFELLLSHPTEEAIENLKAKYASEEGTLKR